MAPSRREPGEAQIASGPREQSSFSFLCPRAASGPPLVYLEGGLMAQKELFLWGQTWKRSFFSLKAFLEMISNP